jgi:hypothetical protein
MTLNPDYATCWKMTGGKNPEASGLSTSPKSGTKKIVSASTSDLTESLLDAVLIAEPLAGSGHVPRCCAGGDGDAGDHPTQKSHDRSSLYGLTFLGPQVYPVVAVSPPGRA